MITTNINTYFSCKQDMLPSYLAMLNTSSIITAATIY